MSVDGWHPDPYGIHEERLFAHGEPTPLVRDGGIGHFDALPGPDDPLPRVRTQGRPGARRVSKPWLGLAAMLIAAGVILGSIGIVVTGGNGNTVTTTTLNPLVRTLLHLPPATTPSTLQAQPPTSTLTSIEQALAALPKSTTPASTTTQVPVIATTAPRRKSTTSGPVTTRVTQAPARVAAPARTIVPTTVLPLTTMTTSVGQADAAWYVAYGSVFNILQIDLAKLNRALEATSQDLYSSVHPYWQELYADANYAISVPAIPDAATDSTWATALGDLSEGATESIIGSVGNPGTAGFDSDVFNQGAAFITIGTSQLDQALSSVQSAAAATSAASRNQVRGWYQSHGAVLTTLQTDINKLNAVFASTGAADYATLDPYWQQISTDAHNAMATAPIPDTLIEHYWSTALDDLVAGASDCTGSSEALPPNLFDQGVASIDVGSTYLKTTLGALQSLAG